jgi:hypothetical protein
MVVVAIVVIVVVISSPPGRAVVPLADMMCRRV